MHLKPHLTLFKKVMEELHEKVKAIDMEHEDSKVSNGCICFRFHHYISWNKAKCYYKQPCLVSFFESKINRSSSPLIGIGKALETARRVDSACRRTAGCGKYMAGKLN